MVNIQGRWKRPIQPPITLRMLRALKASLNLAEPFDTCIWAICVCAFFGMMRFGETTVASRLAFDGSKHLKHSDAFFGLNLDGKEYARLDLPSAKTAAPGETQQVFLTSQDDVCPLDALRNLAKVVPAGPNDPLFSWCDSRGNIRPMAKPRALEHVNQILGTWGWGMAFGHSFCIGGASFYLAQKVSPEIVRIAGR